MLLMSDRFTFALWMQSEREKRGWSQSDLSRYSGLHRAIISKIETNVSTPSIETFISLAQAFKISPITIIRKAGLLPEGTEATNFEDWQFLIAQLMPAALPATWKRSKPSPKTSCTLTPSSPTRSTAPWPQTKSSTSSPTSAHPLHKTNTSTQPRSCSCSKN